MCRRRQDIKPGNLLLTRGPQRRGSGGSGGAGAGGPPPLLKLADFGIAQLLRGAEQSGRLQVACTAAAAVSYPPAHPRCRQSAVQS